EFWIMVCPINLASEVPAQRTSHHSVGCEVLFAGDTGQRHCRSQPIGSQLAQWSGVFMGDHTGDGPGERRVLGREGVSTLEGSPVKAAKGTKVLAPPFPSSFGLVQNCFWSAARCFRNGQPSLFSGSVPGGRKPLSYVCCCGWGKSFQTSASDFLVVVMTSVESDACVPGRSGIV